MSFPAPGGGTVSAQASWDAATTLELEIDCPDGVSAERTGASGLSLEVDDSSGSGSCTVTLALPEGEHVEVAYTLDVNPAP